MKGSYTPEAAWIMFIALMLIYSIICRGFDLYAASAQQMGNWMEETPSNVVTNFRMLEKGEMLWNSITNET